MKKVFNVDVSLKYIIVEIGERSYTVQFRYSLRKGIHDVIVISDGKEHIKVTGTYPPLKKILCEMWRIYIPIWFKKVSRRQR